MPLFWPIAVLFLAALILLVLYLRERMAGQSFRHSSRELLDQRDRQLEQLDQELRDVRKQHQETFGALQAERSRNAEQQRHMEDQLKESRDLQHRFQLEFEQLAGRMLDEKSKTFAAQNQHNLDVLLTPLKERLQAFERKVEETYQQETRERYNLSKELQRLYEMNQALSAEATNLSRALKSDSKIQGQWGEFLLERILEASGLEKGVHYRLQQSFREADGTVRRPDAIIQLPENRHVIIDSKVSLTAFERYLSSEADLQRQEALKAHVTSVRKHIDELGDKNYEQLLSGSPDFVLMFIPLEPAYGLALVTESGLFEYAFRKKVILVSASSLLATLRIIEGLWRLERQNANAAEIVRKASDLYDKLVNFVADLKDVGAALGKADAAYRDAMNKLSEGRGNLLKRAEQMHRLGLETRRRLPEELLHDLEEPEDPLT